MAKNFDGNDLKQQLMNLDKIDDDTENKVEIDSENSKDFALFSKIFSDIFEGLDVKDLTDEEIRKDVLTTCESQIIFYTFELSRNVLETDRYDIVTAIIEKIDVYRLIMCVLS